MDSLKRLRVDPRNYRIGSLLLRRVWRLASPYWTRRGALGSILAYAFVIVLIPVFVFAWAQSTAITAALTDAIIARDAENTRLHLVSLVCFGLAMAGLFMCQSFVDSRLQLHWRGWLTRHVVDRYLRKRVYFDISLMEDLDNPDQRIQEEIGPLVQILARTPRDVIQNMLLLATGGVIIAGLTPSLFWFVVTYSLIQGVVTFFLYIPTIKQNFELTVAEADLRYGILHVRDHAETVAFYRGEEAERHQIEARLKTALKKQSTIIYYGVVMAVVAALFGIIWTIGPYALLVPLYFAGDIQFGAIAQATAAAGTMVAAMTSLTNFIPQVSAVAPKAVRLAEILERFDALDAHHVSRRGIDIVPGDEVAFDRVRLETPGHEQTLIENLTFQITRGTSLLIVGQTGVGKSSLLRAMAGLWRRGEGTITMPAASHCLFLPQRPYMILANLRAQLLYPGVTREVDDEELHAALDAVCLPNLTRLHGGLGAERDWAKVLSLGEQQRIAVARALIRRPRYIFMDEATSAVDVATEARLYRALKATGATIVSVGHRDSLLAFHDSSIELGAHGRWSFQRLGPAQPSIDTPSPALKGNS